MPSETIRCRPVSNGTVVLIDDNRTYGLALRAPLKGANLHLECFEDGEEALDLMRQWDFLPRLMIVDLMMPVMTGFQFLRHKAEDANLSPVPVLVFSGSAGFSFDGLRGAGPMHFLRKPLPLETLAATVIRYAQTYAAIRKVYAASPAIPR